MKLRVGHGFDVHALAEQRPLILAGVRVEYSKGLVGHSDADVVLHALTDALLGAAGLPDIGEQFPDTDEYYRGADSSVLLDTAWRLVKSQGWSLINADTVVMAQAPKLKKYKLSMRASIASIMGVDESQIGLKATTTEYLGFLGRGEGIAASSVVLLSSE